MAILNLGTIGKTEKYQVTDGGAAGEFVAGRFAATYVVSSDRSIHVVVDKEGGASDEDFRLDQGDYARLHLMQGQVVSFVLADGEADGEVFVTEIA